MQYLLSKVGLGDTDMLVRQCEFPAMRRDPLQMIMFPNADPNPKEEEEEIRWTIESLQESLGKDSCYFRKVTDCSGCFAGLLPGLWMRAVRKRGTRQNQLGSMSRGTLLH